MFDKFVYCPSFEHMGEAEKLAEKYLLPIYDGELNEDLSWVDRSCASIVFSNNKSELQLAKKSFIGLPSFLSYYCPNTTIDNFSVQYENILTPDLIINGQKLIVESNYIHCFAILPTIGKWRVFVFINNELVDSEIIEVRNVSYSF